MHDRSLMEFPICARKSSRIGITRRARPFSAPSSPRIQNAVVMATDIVSCVHVIDFRANFRDARRATLDALDVFTQTINRSKSNVGG